MREIIANDNLIKGQNPKYIENLYNPTPKKQNKHIQSSQKMGRKYEQTFLQRRHTGGQQTHENMLNITHHQRNEHQKHNDICQKD